MKRTSAALLALALAALCAGAAQAQQRGVTKNEIVLGTIQDLSGPIAAFGNSDGDFQMLQWATSAPGRRFGLIVHHTDLEREYAYDRKSPFGKLNKALDAAESNGWIIVSMKEDWKRIFNFQ